MECNVRYSGKLQDAPSFHRKKLIKWESSLRKREEVMDNKFKVLADGQAEMEEEKKRLVEMEVSKLTLIVSFTDYRYATTKQSHSGRFDREEGTHSR